MRYRLGSKELTVKQADPDSRHGEDWFRAQWSLSRAGGAYGTEMNQKRILQAAEIIRLLDYDQFATPRAMAAEWGVSERYAKQLCTYAMGVVREEYEDGDYARTTVLGSLDRVIKGNIKNPKVGNQGLVVKAAKVYAEIVGIKAPVELRLSRGDDIPSDPQQLAAMAAELSKRILGAGTGDAKEQTDHPAAGGEIVATEDADWDEVG